ncbi:peptide-methionine (S)-S-oxide reductase MsrA [Tenacibaculum ovolyticum]|uniref:peptide-methionine (S)-S-oxide reductase MsrA n=1 Tax=Tenacibaculum ovolyticum TaxID=104270 RepID=UPI0022F3B822|nr:peptide-methionine (S)-S-oxide reductase MsrA [Tenacibaculum ovolyticum]WBX78249.1 peptide-methionine (S)-S-oxide reductase MsrA [Tenacibaculum ovolyticum]
MKLIKILALLVILLSLLGFKSEKIKKLEGVNKEKKELKKAYFASGCFWCVEAVFESVIGVEEVVSGYAGGHTQSPTYKKIGTGRTGHAETVAVYYNPKKVSFQTLVTVFYGSHDPTTVNGQHPDYGSQYRSIAFYSTVNEKRIIEATIKKLNTETYKGKIVTEVTKFTKFYPAEEYHQNYERLHPENPYVKNVSVPRLNRFKRNFPQLLKKGKH